MKLVNFSLYHEPHSIEIEAMLTSWDLHNVADFTGFTFTPIARRFEMNWRIDPRYALREYPAEEFQIVFREVSRLEISASDPDLPFEEEACLSAVSRLRPEDVMVPYPKFILGEQFDLLFEFQSGRRIRVGAAEAEFLVRKDEPV